MRRPVLPTEYALEARARQALWKGTSPELPEAARRPGVVLGKVFPFLLPAEHAAYTLWAPIRAEVLAHFAREGVAWHSAGPEVPGSRPSAGPSPHLLDPQVCALNFWWGLSLFPDVLTAVLRFCFPEAVRTVGPREGGALLVAGWVGARNATGPGAYLRGHPIRAADLLLAFEDSDGRRHGVLLASCYSERPADAVTAPPTPSEVASLQALLGGAASPLLRTVEVPPGALLGSPLERHLRLQLLASEMEAAGELGFSTVSVLHVAPHENPAAREVSAPFLGLGRGSTSVEVWRSLLEDPTRARSAGYEELFALVAGLGDTRVVAWSAYQQARYGWTE